MLIFLSIILSFNLYAQDTYEKDQWHFNNTSKEIIINKDLHNKKSRKSKDDFDINASNITKLKLKKEVVVAVIGTGVDINHPDLKNNIFKNKVECIDGKAPFLTDEDKDKNGFPGDCHGWNFLSLTEIEIRNYIKENYADWSEEKKKGLKQRLEQIKRNPYDTNGHETHIAGIIAAVSNNNRGVKGFSNQIKILPLKVYDTSTAAAQNFLDIAVLSKTVKKPISKLIKNAINYAIRMKVDVINLSLGLKRKVLINDIRPAIKRALQNNIIIVASANNFSSNDAAYPCQEIGVICVGSVNRFGELASTSNFGKDVDILAPGESILSTYPTSLYPLNFFLENGYSVQSGTSQATPIISAAAALLKGLNPEINSLDLKRKILNATRSPLEKQGYTSSTTGLIQFDKLLEENSYWVFPRFKITKNFKFDAKEKTVTGSLFFQNYSNKKRQTKIRVSTQDSKFFNFDPYETKEFKFKLLDYKESNESQLKLSVFINQREWIIKVPIIIVNNNDHYVIKSLDTKKRLLPILSQSKRNYNFYNFEKRADNNIYINLYKESETEIKKSYSLNINKPKKVISLFKEDLNYDGKNDFLLITQESILENEKNIPYYKYHYLSKDLTPLFKGKSSFLSKIEFHTIEFKNQRTTNQKIATIPISADSIRFIKNKLDENNDIAIPIFLMRNSIIPKREQKNLPFSLLETRPSDQIFTYKINEKLNFQITSLSKRINHQEIFPYSPKNNSLKIYGPLKPSVECPSNQCFEFTILNDSTYYKESKNVKVFGTFSIIKEIDKDFDLENNVFIESLDLDNKKINKLNIERTNYGESIFINNKKQSFISFEEFSKYANLKNFISNDSVILNRTKDINKIESIYIDLKTKQKIKVQKNWVNYTFVTHKELMNMIRPITIKINGQAQPAFLWDARRYNESSFRTLVFKKGEILSPVKFNIMPPKGCSPLSIRYNEQSDFFELPFQCLNNTLRIYPFTL